MPASSRTNGFTLLELSLVLVIIGLLVGGVLVGRDLIKAAEIRAQIKQLESYRLALNAFKLKYNCLPGDCASASAFGLGSNGNGNGKLEMNSISGCWYITDNNYSQPDCNWNGEFPLFFQHLSAARMIDGSFNGTWVIGRGYPRLALNNRVGMMAAGGWGTSGIGSTPDYLSRDYKFPSANGYWLHLKICNPSEDDPGMADEGCGTVTPAQAYQIDTKIDDGKPLSGIFWGYTPSYDFDPFGPLQAYCLNGSYTAYNLNTNVIACHAAYRMN